MEGWPNRRNNAGFSNSPGIVWTVPQLLPFNRHHFAKLLLMVNVFSLGGW